MDFHKAVPQEPAEGGIQHADRKLAAPRGKDLLRLPVRNVSLCESAKEKV